jgi:hypothetical protein
MRAYLIIVLSNNLLLLNVNLSKMARLLDPWNTHIDKKCQLFYLDFFIAIFYSMHDRAIVSRNCGGFLSFSKDNL